MDNKSFYVKPAIEEIPLASGLATMQNGSDVGGGTTNPDEDEG